MVRALAFVLTLVVVPALASAQGARGAPGAPPDPTVPKGTGIALGQVVDAASGQPIAEAIVSVNIRTGGGARGAGAGGRGAGAAAQGAAAPQPQTPPGPRIPANVHFITDATGHFVARDLPKATLVVNVEAPGYISGGWQGPIDEGQHLRDVKVTLQKYGVITGTILDDVGDPAVSVTVRAMQRGRNGLAFGSEDKTDDRGTYRLAQLTPGEYMIVVPQTQMTVPVATFNSLMQGLMGGSTGAGNTDLRDLATSAAGFSAVNGLRVGDLQVGSSSGLTPVMSTSGQIFVAPTTFYPTAATPSAATIVKVASGEERSGIDMQLRVVPTAKVSGTVSGPAGMGLMQVQMRAVSADADQTNFDAATTIASANGTFTFLGVPSGNYMVRIVREPPPQIPPELASNPFIQMAMGSRNGALQTMMFAQAPVNVGTADVTGLSLTLAPGLTVGGHVVFDGSAAKPDANALAAINVSLIPTSQPAPSGNARVDFTGAFKTTGSLPGRYVLNVGSPPPPWVMLSCIANGHDLLKDGVDLTADVTDAVVTFTDRAATITGTVRAASGALPPNTTVYLLPVDFEAWIANGMSGRGPYLGGASPTGTFSIGRVTPGEYLLAAASQPIGGATVGPDFYRTLARSATKVTVALGDHPNVDAPLVRIQ